MSDAISQLNKINLQQTTFSDLKKFLFFKEIDEFNLQKTIDTLIFYAAGRGETVWNKGLAGNHLLFLFSGRLHVIDISENGHASTFDFVTPGNYFGELAIIDGLPQAATLIASETSTYALMPSFHALELIYGNPRISEQIFKKLAAHVRQASSFRNILGIPNAFQRVYALLNHLSKSSLSGLVVIERLPTQQEISVMINTSRETVSRAIQVLIQSGVVEKDLRRLIIRKPEALREKLNASKFFSE